MRDLKHPATIIAGIALFVALGGWATAASVLISGSQIKKHSIPKNRLTGAAIKSLRGKTSNAYYYALNLNDVALGASGATVDTLTLGAGSYVVMANTSLYNDSSDDLANCSLKAGGQSIDVGYVGLHLQPSATVPGFSRGQQVASLLAPLTFAGGGVTLVCLGEDTHTFATRSRIVAIKFGSRAGAAGHFPNAPEATVSG